MASQPEIVQSCVAEAAAAARGALERCIDDAVAALQIAETQSMRVAERDQMAAAWRDLLKSKTSWADEYAARLLNAFNRSVSETAEAVAFARGGIFPTEQASQTSQTQKKLQKSNTPRSLQTPPDRPIVLLDETSYGGQQLSLVDDNDVSQAIESSRLLQVMLPAVDQTLAELDKLMSSAQGLPNVRPELNPMRPEVFANTLREMIFSSSADAEISTLWIRHLAPPLGRQIRLLYERSVNQFEMANVQAVSYRVVPTASGSAMGGRGRRPAGEADEAQEGAGDAQQGGSGGIGGGSDHNGAAKNKAGGSGHAGSAFGYVSDEPIVRKPSQYADLSRDSVSDALFQDFLLKGGASAEHGLAPAYYDNIEEELRALKAAPDSVSAQLEEGDEDAGAPPTLPSSYQNMAVVDRPQRKISAGSQLSQKVWGAFGGRKERAIVAAELKHKAERVGQVMGLAVVRKLVNQVAQDPRLLSPVREGIVALEPSLLRLAMVDPRFFDDEKHPGRRLMERVAQRSFKYNDDYAHEFSAFFDPVKAAFKALNELTISDAQPFTQALAGLENVWHEQDAEEAAKRNALLQALRFAEERQAVADQIAFDLSNRSDLDEVPGLVLDFLFGPWALAMAHARLTDTRHQVDPQGLGLVVPDLIWSAKRQMTMRQPAKLIEMIPGLLTRLHAGLELLDRDPRESEPFFAGLMRIHQPVLKLRRLKTQRDAEESADAPLEPEEMPATPEQRRAKAAAQPWLGREDREAAGFEDAVPTESSDLSVTEEAEGLSAPAARLSDGVERGEAEPKAAAENTVAEIGVAASEASLAAAAHEGESPDSTHQADDPSDSEAILLTLRSGAWVDLFYRRRWLRAQLVWASSKGTLFMFVSHGGRAHSMTRRSCERLIRERLLRPVDAQGVVAQALDAVVNEAAARVAPESAAAR